MNRKKIVRAKQILLYPGEATASVTCVIEGVVKVYTTLSNGSEMTIAVFGPGDYFPLADLSDTATTALLYHEALSDYVLETMSHEEYFKHRSDATEVLNYFGRRYQGVLLHMTALVQLTAREKLVHIMRYLALRFGEEMVAKKYTRINVKLTQQDIADLTNMSRETASIELQKLKKEQVVVEKEKFYSVNIRQITKMIGDDFDEQTKL